MSRAYGKISSVMFTDQKSQQWDDCTFRVATYLLAGPHTNLIGCFRLPISYVCEDLNKEFDCVSQAFSVLQNDGFISYCRTTKWVWIRKFLRHNQIENPNIAKGAVSLAWDVPKNASFYDEFCIGIRKTGKWHFAKDSNKDLNFSDLLPNHSEPYRNPSETLSKPFRNPIETLSEPFRNPIETLSEPYRNPSETLSKPFRNPIETLSEPYRNPSETLSEPYRNPSETLSKHRDRDRDRDGNRDGNRDGDKTTTTLPPPQPKCFSDGGDGCFVENQKPESSIELDQPSNSCQASQNQPPSQRNDLVQFGGGGSICPSPDASNPRAVKESLTAASQWTADETLLVEKFLAMREHFWPHEARLPSPRLTLLTQARSYLEDGMPADLAIEVINRCMTKTSGDGKLAPNSFKAYELSLANSLVNWKKSSKTTPQSASPEDQEELAQAFDLYNQTAARAGLLIAQVLTEDRKKSLRQRLKECGGIDGWEAALAKLEASNYCRGGSKNGWIADLDFMLQSQNFVRLMEGRYDDRDQNNSSDVSSISSKLYLRAVAEEQGLQP